jgi:hypothetical protein
LDELEDLKQRMVKGQVQPKDAVDALADEARGRQPKPKELTEQDLQQMPVSTLISLIMENVTEQVAQPLLVKIEEMRIRDEIRELTRDGKNPDFDEYKKEIFEICSKNPNLSIEQGYRLAKAGKPPKEGEGEDKDTKRGLPPRRKVQPVSEKPGAHQGGTTKPEPQTRAEAAQLAWDELKAKGKV